MGILGTKVKLSPISVLISLCHPCLMSLLLYPKLFPQINHAIFKARSLDLFIPSMLLNTITFQSAWPFKKGDKEERKESSANVW